MEGNTENELSRAVSHIDLNAALAASQSQTARYTTDELLNLRTSDCDLPKQAERVENIEVYSDGLVTPSEQVHPKPPPPTPEIQVTVPSPVEGDELPTIEEAAEPRIEEHGEKKKKKNSKSGKARKIVTGFEEFYADPPITPAEYKEELDAYDASRPFHERIEVAIQRYRARRNLDSERSNILTKYLMLGGVDATAKTFTGGLDKETLEESNAAEIAAIRAQDHIRPGNKKYYDPSEQGWVVDFKGVAEGFFSYRVPSTFATSDEGRIKQYCGVIRNFLNYVLVHNVAPEYVVDVMNARRVCDLAEKELWSIHQIKSSLPGDFNVAASTLYGGHYQDLHLSALSWLEQDPGKEDVVALNHGMSVAEAERVFKTAVAFAGSDDLFRKVMSMDCELVKTERKFYEVFKINRAQPILDEEGEVIEPQAGDTKPLGTFIVKTWEGPGLDDEDFTDEEDAGVQSKVAEVETFFLEDEILELMYVGLKMELTVQELSVGLKFFDIAGLYCSFYKYLPNEKMGGWKEPEPNTRPPPTEDDPDVEERAMDAAMDRDFDDEKM